MRKLCVMTGVIEYNEGGPVELWVDSETGKLYVCAFCEGKFNTTLTPLEELMNWIRNCPIYEAPVRP